MKRIFTNAVVFSAVFTTAAVAQTPLSTRAARLADVQSIDGIIAAFYDIVSGPAGQKRDWARDSTLYIDGIRFTIINRTPDGRTSISPIDHATFARSSSPSLERGFFESEINRVTHTFGPMAHVFSTYEWRATKDGPVGGRGINSIQLVNNGSRWFISAAMWTDESPENPIPAQYLPKK